MRISRRFGAMPCRCPSWAWSWRLRQRRWRKRRRGSLSVRRGGKERWRSCFRRCRGRGWRSRGPTWHFGRRARRWRASRIFGWWVWRGIGRRHRRLGKGGRFYWTIARRGNRCNIVVGRKSDIREGCIRWVRMWLMVLSEGAEARMEERLTDVVSSVRAVFVDEFRI